MSQVGIPLFYLQGMGQGMLKFRDLFNDSSQYWAWQLYKGETPAGKNGIEANGRYTLGINQGINGQWATPPNNEAPRLFMGALSYPCEIITRLDVFSRNFESVAGLFLAKTGIQASDLNHFAIVQAYTGAVNGVCVIKDDSPFVATTVVQTLPMWLRIRLGGGSTTSVTAYFDYSVDGLNWVNLYQLPEVGYYYFNYSPPCVGLYCANFASFNEVVAGFDFFQMKPKSIN